MCEIFIFGIVPECSRKNTCNWEAIFPRFPMYFAWHSNANSLRKKILTLLKKIRSKTKKPRLRKLITMLLAQQVSELHLTHKDRLLRFGHELVFQLCRWSGCKVIIHREDEVVSFEQELVKDVITLMTVFSARLYGRRSHQNNNQTQSRITDINGSQAVAADGIEQVQRQSLPPPKTATNKSWDSV